jgi:hypothetical protein
MQPESHYLVANGNVGVKVQIDYYRSCGGAVGIPEVPTPDNMKQVFEHMIPCVRRLHARSESHFDGVRFFDDFDNVVMDVFGS